MAIPNWPALHARLTAIRDRGAPLVEIDLNAPRPSATAKPKLNTVIPNVVCLRFSPKEYAEVRQVVAEAYGLACSSAPSIAREISEAVERRCGQSLSQAIAVENWTEMFRWRFRRDAHHPRRISGAIHADFLEERTVDGDSHFQALVEELLNIFTATKALPAQGPSPDQEYWTVAEVAAMHGVKPETIRKRVCKYRKDHGGRDPLWVRRSEGQIRDYLIHAPTYRSELRASRRRISREG